MEWDDVAIWIGSAGFVGLGVIKSEPWLVFAGLVIAALQYVIYMKDKELAELRAD